VTKSVIQKEEDYFACLAHIC